ncbi:MAG: M20/M25/M40 family metallo-hydrolase, partial [Thermoanaerobaculia bacterium]
GLLLLHHIDVVPADGSAWKSPPFAAEILMNELYGRGAVDMKGIGITHLLAFIDVARSGKQPARDIALLAVSDEESGGANGMSRLIEQRPDLFDGIRYAIGEGGVTEVTREKVSYFGIEIGNLQYAEVTVRAPSIEALRAARFEIEGWNARRQADRITPEVRRFMADIAPTRLSFGDELADIDGAVASGAYWKLPLPYRLLTQNVIWMEGDRIEDGRAQAKGVLLLLPDENAERWVGRLDAAIQRHGAGVSEVISLEPSTPMSPIDTPLFELIADEARREFDGRTGTMVLHRQRNDSRFLRRRGIAAYGVQPFPVDAYQSEALHRADERARLDWFMQGVGMMRRVVFRWAFETDI